LIAGTTGSYTAMGDPPGGTYDWSGPSSADLAAPNSDPARISIRPLTPQTLVLSVRYTIKGSVCSASMTVTVQDAIAPRRPSAPATPTPMAPVRPPAALASAPQTTSQAVLGHLANIVGSMADGAKVQAQLLNQLGATYADYVHSARALLTGQPVSVPNSTGGTADAPIVADRPGAVSAVNALGASTASMMGALADVGASTAQGLGSVQQKEEEEKKNPGPGIAPNPGATQDPGSKPQDPASTPQDPGSTPPGPGSQPQPQPTPAPTPGKPVTPTTPIPPTVTVKKKRTRRCFQFTVTNPGTADISDLHFQQNGLVPASTAGPSNWTNLLIVNKSGFAWQTKSPQDNIKPGKSLGPFTFCLEDILFGGDIFVTHPDPKNNPPQKLSPNDIRANGGPVGVNKDGTLALPVMKDGTTYITDFDVKINGDQQSVNLQVSGGPPEVTGGNGVLGGTPVPNVAALTPKPGSSFSDGEHVTVTIESKNPNATLKGV